MAIVCGVELNENDEPVTRAAAALARRMREALVLVHVGKELERAKARLDEIAQRLNAAGVETRDRLAEGDVLKALSTPAGDERVHLVVIGAGGRPALLQRLLGSTADRVVEASTVPVLVVRDPTPFEEWAAARRRLRVALAFDLSAPSESAARWTRAFARFGACEVSVVHSFGEVSERYRYGLGLEVDKSDLEKLVTRDVQEQLAAAGLSQTKLVVRVSAERTGEQVAALTEKEQADLVVVGTHVRTGARLPWSGSVSHELLRHASSSVACIAAEAAPAREFPPTPRTRLVLVPTDLEPHTRRALAHAYSLVEEHGTVVLLHVVDAGPPGPLPESVNPEHWRRDVTSRLEALLPLDIGNRPCTTRLEVDSGKDVAVAVAQAAERLGADLVCLAGRSRARLSRAVGPSVVRELLAVARRPVVVLPPVDE